MEIPAYIVHHVNHETVQCLDCSAFLDFLKHTNIPQKSKTSAFLCFLVANMEVALHEQMIAFFKIKAKSTPCRTFSTCSF